MLKNLEDLSEVKDINLYRSSRFFLEGRFSRIINFPIVIAYEEKFPAVASSARLTGPFVKNPRIKLKVSL